LILEYLQFENLEDQHKQQSITDQESFIILCQNLDALTFVYEDEIVHRDIKSESILVQSRSSLHIKLSDFDLSKTIVDLKIFCETHLYAASKIYTNHCSTYYTKICDILWRDVIVFKYVYESLSDIRKTGIELSWCREIINWAKDWDSDILLNLLLTAMLVINSEKRLSTRKCWKQTLQLSVLSQSRCVISTQTSYSESDCLKRTLIFYQTILNVMSFETTTFVMTKVFRNQNFSIQKNKMKLTQMTINHYLIDNDIEEQEVRSQKSSKNSSNKIRNQLTFM
jgi:serine/threonine protein kinase